MIERMTVSLPKDLREFVDRLAASRRISRSQLIAEFIRAEERKVLDQQLVEGYRATGSEHGRFVEDAIGAGVEAWKSLEPPTPF